MKISILLLLCVVFVSVTASSVRAFAPREDYCADGKSCAAGYKCCCSGDSCGPCIPDNYDCCSAGCDASGKCFSQYCIDKQCAGEDTCEGDEASGAQALFSIMIMVLGCVAIAICISRAKKNQQQRIMMQQQMIPGGYAMPPGYFYGQPMAMPYGQPMPYGFAVPPAGFMPMPMQQPAGDGSMPHVPQAYSAGPPPSYAAPNTTTAAN